MREHRPQQSIDGSQISDVRKEKDYQVPDLTPCAAGAASGDLPPSAEEVRSQLTCVVESWEFRKSKRSQQFLQHVVDCALRGDVERLKESVIGIELFERAPGYDAGGDSSVRVRASDVRRRLLAYYQRVGTGAHVQIGLAPGSYIPRFARLPSTPAALPNGTEAAPPFVAHPFLPRPGDAHLRRFHEPAAELNADAYCDLSALASHAQSKAEYARDLDRLAHRDGPEAAGPDFLYSLLARLTDATRADCVYIGTVTAGDADTVKTIAVMAGGRRRENFEYSLAGSPCENVVGKTVLIFPQAVQREFPNNSILQKMDVESYAGAPLFDCRGGSLGLLAVLSRQPIRDTQLAKSVLEVYACRIAAELARQIVEHALDKAERRIRESEERFRVIFGNAGIGIVVVDFEGRLIESNPAIQTVLGYSETELAGMAFSDYSHPGDLDSDMHLFTELLQGKRERYQMEKRYIHKDGKVVWAVLTASLLRGPTGGLQHCIRIVNDITQHKRAEKERVSLEQQLQQAQKLKGIGRLDSGVAHA